MKLLRIPYSTLTTLLLWQGSHACISTSEINSCVIGEVICTYTMMTGSKINPETCMELINSRFVGQKRFFELNPQLEKDCANIKPNTEYCVIGCVCEAPLPNPIAGEIICRYESQKTDPEVDENTCQKIADFYQKSTETFYKLNPQLDKDCKNVQPNTKYCVSGYIEPLRAWDGLCGPEHNNATCRGTEKGCCNSETWQCGNSENDCRPGTCYEGYCHGVNEYSVDGKCGSQHDDRKCGSKWGDCCNFDGICGTGPEFCGIGQCQSGECSVGYGMRVYTEPWGESRSVSWLNGNTTDGTCGGPNKITCQHFHGNCCSKDGKCGSLVEHCGDGCQSEFGHCFTRFASPSAAASSTVTLPSSGKTEDTGPEKSKPSISTEGEERDNQKPVVPVDQVVLNAEDR